MEGRPIPGTIDHPTRIEVDRPRQHLSLVSELKRNQARRTRDRASQAARPPTEVDCVCRGGHQLGLWRGLRRDRHGSRSACDSCASYPENHRRVKANASIKIRPRDLLPAGRVKGNARCWGRITESITWMTPFEHWISVFITLALSTITLPS